MNGIGLLSGSFTPHYSDSKRAEKYRENIKKRPAFKKAMLVNYKSTEVANNGTT